MLSRLHSRAESGFGAWIFSGLTAAFLLLSCSSAFAATITVSASDSASTNIAKITGAVAGDVVEIGPGTYRFCVKLNNSGTPGNPIVIRAADPDNKPVFDLGIYENLNSSGDSYYAASDWGLGSWPGGNWGAGAGIAPHNDSGNWDRGAIVVWEAGYIDIEDIEIINVHNNRGDANAIRVNASGGPVNIRGCKLTYSDNGIDVTTIGSGSGDEVVTISNCEIAYNGRYPNQAPPGGHNIYTHDGTMVLEYSYIHHATEGQNFHLRNKAATIRYCRSESPYAYHADMSDINGDGDRPSVQIHTYIGNLFVDGQGSEATSGNVFTVMEGSFENIPQRLNLYYNTFIGAGDSRYLVSFTGAYGLDTYMPSLYMYNNIIWGNTRPTRNQYTGTYGPIEIRHNWFPTADYSAWSSYMSDNLFGTDPGFVDRVAGNYSLSASSVALDSANGGLGVTAAYEYVYDMDGTARAGTGDLGAFEFDSGGGATTPPPPPSNVSRTDKVQ